MERQRRLRCLIAAGGTVGHVAPSLAVAEALRERGVEVTFAGSPDRVEARLVPERGYAFDAFRVAGFPRRPGAKLARALGLAAVLRARGARIFERTAVTKITFTRKLATVVTDAGAIRTARVVVATGVPGRLFHSLERHFWFGHAFFALTQAMPSRLRQQLGPRAAVLRDAALPPHTIRWVDDERLLVSGADADPIHPSRQTKFLVQRTGQLMYELSTLYPDVSGIQPEYGWDITYSRTVDGLPYFGAHRNFPFHLFAFGNSSPSATGAYLASRIFLRQHLGQSDPADEVFGFHR